MAALISKGSRVRFIGEGGLKGSEGVVINGPTIYGTAKVFFGDCTKIVSSRDIEPVA